MFHAVLCRALGQQIILVDDLNALEKQDAKPCLTCVTYDLLDCAPVDTLCKKPSIILAHPPFSHIEAFCPIVVRLLTITSGIWHMAA
jgi:hypothetical protein